MNSYFGKTISLSLGVAFLVLFWFEKIVPVEVSIVVFVYISVALLILFREKKIGILTLIVWLCYALPFMHIVAYIGFDYTTKPLLGFGRLAANSYMFDKDAIALMSMIGATGGLGVLCGTVYSSNRFVVAGRSDLSVKPRVTLPFSFFILWLGLGLGLSWLIAPQDSLFSAEYTQSTSAFSNVNFASAWMVSYIVFLFALSDALLERSRFIRKLKIRAFILVICIAVVYLNLLRGNRDSVPFVFSAILIAYYWAAPYWQDRYNSIDKKLWLRISLIAILLVFISRFVGVVRHSLVGINEFQQLITLVTSLRSAGVLDLSTFLYGTWSAALLTPLSISGDYLYYDKSLEWGKDYVDILLSMPPGFIADTIGYVRPLDISDPALEMRYGIGGVHAVVLPFRNFGMIGVFLITAFWSALVLRFEARALRTLRVSSLALLGTVALLSPHWLWYGEKIAINTLVIWLVVYILYRLSVSIPNWLDSQSISNFSSRSFGAGDPNVVL